MEKATPGNMNISGSGTAGGGIFNNVHISGSGHVQGEIEANEINISGSGKIDSHVRAKTFKSSGSVSIGGNVTAELFSSSGAADIDGDVEAGQFHSSGSSKIGGRLKAREFHSSGTTSVAGNVHADELHIFGSSKFHSDVEAAHIQSASRLTVGGLLNGDTVDIVLAGDARAREIGGERIVVAHPGRLKSAGGWEFCASHHTLTAETIEGDDIYLESTIASMVRGRRVVLGANSNIKTVEYGESLLIDPRATVEQEKFTGQGPAPEVNRCQAEPPEGWARQKAQQLFFTHGFTLGKWGNPLLGILAAVVALIVAFGVIGLVLAIVLPIIGIVFTLVGLLLLLLLLALPVLLIIRRHRKL